MDTALLKSRPNYGVFLPLSLLEARASTAALIGWEWLQREEAIFAVFDATHCRLDLLRLAMRGRLVEHRGHAGEELHENGYGSLVNRDRHEMRILCCKTKRRGASFGGVVTLKGIGRAGMSVLTDSLEADDTTNPHLLSYRCLDVPKGVKWHRVIQPKQW
jgi:hypothetical protein